MNKIWDLTNSNDMQFFSSDILLRKKKKKKNKETSPVDGILEIFCPYSGTMTHQFCKRKE